MLLAELFTGCTNVLGRAGVVHFRTKATENTVYIRLIAGIRLRPKRRPQICGGRKCEVRRSHSDNDAQLAAKSDGAANNPRISTKVSLPKILAKHNGVGSAGAIFVFRKTTAQEKLDSERAEKIRTDTQGMKPLWLSCACEINARRSKRVSGHCFEAARMLAPEQKFSGACGWIHPIRKLPLNKH